MRLFADTEDGGDCLGDERRIGQAGELDVPETGRKRRWRVRSGPRRRDGTGEAGFAAPAGAGQGEQPVGAEQAGDRDDRVLSADKPGEERWQIMRRPDGRAGIMAREWLRRREAAAVGASGIAGDRRTWYVRSRL